LASPSQRRWSSGAGYARAPEAIARGTGTPPGAFRGRGLGEPLGATEREDAWWLVPALQGLMALVAVGYSAWSGMNPQGGEFDGYHSPIHARLWLGPLYIPAPAWLMLAIPVLFRATCYYFRKAYYRSFFLDPPACAVGEPRKGYGGENSFPFVLQNLHRYLLYLALVLMVVHWTNVARSFAAPEGGVRAGVGSLLLVADTALLSLYTLSCHAFRHLVGGSLDCFSCARAGTARHRAWSWVSALNGHHMGYFWWSLYTICLADLYVRLLHAGVLADPRVTF
jgi:hypothetical protein